MTRRDPIELLVSLWGYDPTEYDPDQYDEGVSLLAGAVLMVGLMLLIAFGFMLMM